MKKCEHYFSFLQFGTRVAYSSYWTPWKWTFQIRIWPSTRPQSPIWTGRKWLSTLTPQKCANRNGRRFPERYAKQQLLRCKLSLRLWCLLCVKNILVFEIWCVVGSCKIKILNVVVILNVSVLFTQIRKFRTLSELIVDAQDYVRNPYKGKKLKVWYFILKYVEWQTFYFIKCLMAD